MTVSIQVEHVTKEFTMQYHRTLKQMAVASVKRLSRTTKVPPTITWRTAPSWRTTRSPNAPGCNGSGWLAKRSATSAWPLASRPVALASPWMRATIASWTLMVACILSRNCEKRSRG